MKTKLATFLFILIFGFGGTKNAFSQVTVGSDEAPQKFSILEVISSSENPGGIRLPHLSEADKASVKAELLSNPTKGRGLLIYNTNLGQVEYWDGTDWVVSKVIEPWMVSGSTTQVASSNTQNIYQMGQVTIGSNETVDATAALNVVATNKGVLLPRVKLTASDDKVTIPDPTVGLLVFNEGTSTFPTEGYMYWNGLEWRLISTSTSVAPTATIVCGQGRLDPEQVLQAGTPILAGTVLKVPYTVGNGGMYNAAILKTTDLASDVKATISDGLFENGSGYLAFNVTGTPTSTQATPTGITFDLTPFYTANPTLDPLNIQCKTVTVGTEIKADIYEVATMDNLKLTHDNGVTGYATNLTTPDGKFTVRAFIVSSEFNSSAGTFGQDDVYGMNLQIRSNASTDVVIAGQFNWQWGGAGGNGSNKLGLQPGFWTGDNAEQSTTRLLWGHYVSDVRGTNWSADAGSILDPNIKNRRGHFVHWGDNGVNAGGIPERRTYSWTINDGAITKTAYILTFSTSVMNNIKANSTTCPGGVCPDTKVFMMIQQITAP